MKKKLSPITKQARQGDVFLLRTKKKVTGKELPREEGAIVLAHGEVTGHAHKVTDSNVVAFLRAEGAAYDLIRVTEEGCTLRHLLPGGGQADHDEIPIGSGTFEVRIQQEWDYLAEMARAVVD
jgi:hypothetical protein